MRILTVNWGVPSVAVTVPEDCSAILAFRAVGLTADTLGADVIHRPIQAVLSADPNVNFSQSAAGTGVKLLMIANQTSPRIPVSPGERLLVAFEDAGTAVIYLESSS